MKDIETPSDIKLLVDSFYKKAIVDEKIGFFFKDVAKLNFEEHMPKMYQFWESTLFHTATYKGNAMLKHIQLSHKHKLTQVHFQQWLSLWEETVNSIFKGETAQKAIQLAKQIGGVMQIKVQQKS
jgi:hemoglobin